MPKQLFLDLNTMVDHVNMKNLIEIACYICIKIAKQKYWLVWLFLFFLCANLSIHN